MSKIVTLLMLLAAAVAVPESTSVLLLIPGLIAVAIFRRRLVSEANKSF